MWAYSRGALKIFPGVGHIPFEIVLPISYIVFNECFRQGTPRSSLCGEVTVTTFFVSN